MKKKIVFKSEEIVRFNSAGRRIRSYLTTYTPAEETKELIPEELWPKETLDAVIISEFFELRNAFGIRTGFYFLNKDREKLGVIGKSYTHLLELATDLSKSSSVYRLISETYIRRNIQGWIFDTEMKSTSADLLSYLLPKLEASLITREYWAPIKWLVTRTTFEVGKIQFVPIDNDELERVTRLPALAKDPQSKAVIENTREYLGFAAAKMSITAEEIQAKQIFHDEVDRSLLMMSLFTAGAMHPKIATSFRIWGCEDKQSVVFLSSDATNFSLSNFMRNGSPNIELIDEKKLQSWSESGLPCLTQLLKASKLTKFQQTILDAALLYGKCAQERELPNKMLYQLAAVESLFIDSNEPILHNLSERLAFFLEDELEERKQIKKIIKDGYAQRSAFFHHGKVRHNPEVLDKFMWTTWRAVMQVKDYINFFKTQKEFLDYLDDLKFSTVPAKCVGTRAENGCIEPQ